MTMKTVNFEPDAFVFFGAPGDLAYKQIFSALQAMIRRGRLWSCIAHWDSRKSRAKHEHVEGNNGLICDPLCRGVIRRKNEYCSC